MLLRDKFLARINYFVPPDDLINKCPEYAKLCPTFALLRFRAKKDKETLWKLGWLFDNDDDDTRPCVFRTGVNTFEYDVNYFDPEVAMGAKGRFIQGIHRGKEFVVTPYPLFYMHRTKKGDYKFTTHLCDIINVGKVLHKTHFDRHEFDTVLLYFQSKMFCKTKLSDSTKFFTD